MRQRHSRLDDIARDLARRADEIAADAAKAIEAGAKSRVIVDSGALRDAIHTETDGDGTYTVIAGDQTVYYGQLVEFGGRNAPARPFMVPAFEDTLNDLPTIAARKLQGL